MYNDDLLRTPTDEKELWEILSEHFKYIEHVLYDHPVETEDDALKLTYRDKKRRGGGLRVIRYRGVSEELDSRDHYLRLGQELCPLVAQLLDERRLTPEFVQVWGQVMFCAGWIASHLFDDTDSLAQARGGRGGRKDKQRIWVSRTILEFLGKGQKRIEAEKSTVERIKHILQTKAFPPGLDEKFFKSIIAGDRLRESYTSKRLSKVDMKKIIKSELP